MGKVKDEGKTVMKLYKTIGKKRRWISLRYECINGLFKKINYIMILKMGVKNYNFFEI